MELCTAFILGFVGSFHCAAMCGPLALALPVTGNSPSSFVLGRIAYNLGRVLTYIILGAVVGLIGHSLSLAGFQGWVSVGAGVVLLLAVAASSRYTLSAPLTRAVGCLKRGFAAL